MRLHSMNAALAAAALVTTLALDAAPVRAQGATKAPPGARPGTSAETWRPPSAGRQSQPAGIPDTTVLLRVNDDVVRVSDFITRYYGAYPEGRPQTDSLGRLTFLRTLENALVLRRVALDRNRPFDFGERATMREHTQRVLSNVLFQRAITDSTQAAEPQLREMYSMLKTEIHIREITFRDLATAQTVYDQIRARKLTWDVAYQRFHELEKKADLGDLGWIKRTSGEPAMVERVFRLQKGELAQPWRDINGVHLVQCTDTRAGNPAPFEVLRARLGEIVRGPQVAERTERISALLRDRIGLVYDTTNIVWVAQRFGETMSISSSGGAPVLSMNSRMPSFTAADTGRVLARHRDGRFTLLHFVEAYRALPPIARPAVNTPDRLRTQIDAIVLEPYRADLAVERGLERDPLAVGWIDKRREELLVDRLYQDSIQSRVAVSEADAKRYYEANRSLYITYPAITYAMWIASGRAGADSIVAETRKGVKLDAIILADSVAKRPARGSVRLMRQNEEGADFYPELFGGGLKPGDAEIVGPDREGKFAVIQMLAFDPGRQLSFEEAYRMVDEAAQHDQAEKLLARFMERHRRTMKVESHPELLMKFPMVDPTL